ncbi:hypothetical protein D3C84_998330 [compost metagenome]
MGLYGFANGLKATLLDELNDLQLNRIAENRIRIRKVAQQMKLFGQLQVAVGVLVHDLSPGLIPG